MAALLSPGPVAIAEARQRKLNAALAKLDLDAAPLPIPPAPWTATGAEDHRRVDRLPDADDKGGTAPTRWPAGDGWWRADRAGEILAKQPARAILAAGFEGPFVSFGEAMLAWTIERRAPAWASRARDVNKADVMEWTHRFGGVLGVFVGLIEPRRAEAGFIAPICAVEEEDTCFDLLTRSSRCSSASTCWIARMSRRSRLSPSSVRSTGCWPHRPSVGPHIAPASCTASRCRSWRDG